MKKFLVLMMALAIAGALVSCASTAAAKPADTKPVAAKATPAPTAAPAPTVAPANMPAVLVLSDFEDPTASYDVYNGPKSSKPVYSFVSDIVHGGKSALKVSMKVSDWGGIVLISPEGKGDWSAYRTLHMWVYGKATGGSWNIDVEDRDLEQFRVTEVDDTAGWKELTIDLASLKKRGDYQAPEAKTNGKVDYPLKSLQFFTASNFSGELIFDDFTLTK